MPTRHVFSTANQIIFGVGTRREIPAIAREFGQRILVVTGRDASRAEPILASLRALNLSVTTFAISGEPDLAIIEQGTTLARNEKCDAVIGIGGGSAVDAGKAIASMATNPGELLDYLEIIGRGQPLTKAPLPYLAVPTTAGTGSESTRNAVLSSPAHRAKVSLRSPLMLPRVAIVDPELTYDLPPAVTASTGLDALTQLIEPFVCSRANPITDALCLDGIPRVAQSLRRAFAGRDAADAREDLSLASLFGGIALANAGLGAVHGLAGPIGGLFRAPHGAICAALLPHVMAKNIDSLKTRAKGSRALHRYEKIARLLTGNKTAAARSSVTWVQQLTSDLNIPRLRRFGITTADFEMISQRAAKSSSMQANPISLTETDLHEILANAL